MTTLVLSLCFALITLISEISGTPPPITCEFQGQPFPMGEFTYHDCKMCRCDEYGQAYCIPPQDCPVLDCPHTYSFDEPCVCDVCSILFCVLPDGGTIAHKTSVTLNDGSTCFCALTKLLCDPDDYYS